ncbi:endoribonuclease Dcr-1 isoform X2 [Venturia canescens]|uniref:endoribonuclease Dcr-1 isoform X2 n=1 Tax=Venturia canescens TaxID=32260 RepID=UPI001C9C5C54|nr:endoribonuclease Dcr-1 isoform X2 [Venturia canescens]
MAFPLNDQVYTKSFTPREYHVQLLYAAKTRNIIVCLGKNTEQTFIVTKLIQEFATGNRRSLQDGGKRIVYLLNDEERCSSKANYIRQLTDLGVTEGRVESLELLEDAGVLTCTVEACQESLALGNLCPASVNLIVVDECQMVATDKRLGQVLEAFIKCKESPRVVGLAVPLFDLAGEPGRLSLEIERLEKIYDCEVETASDILSVLRYGPKPREYIIEYDEKGEKTDLEKSLEDCALHALDFLKDHRYDPSEIYNEQFFEDIQKIPDPTEKPCELVEDFLCVLRTLGPWCADRAALAVLVRTEKLKIKTPYERHYLLLNMVSSIMIKIRALCDSAFDSLTDREKIYRYSKPKVHRLLDTLKTYTPSSTNSTNCTKDRPGKTASSGSLTGSTTTPPKPTTILPHRNSSYQSRRGGGHWRSNDDRHKTGRHHRGVTDPDLLCGVVFVESSFTAKILFYLLNEVSQCDENLHFLSPLYTIERNQDESSFSRDVEMEHRKQEEVLKRFRIHECNLLIATSILEHVKCRNNEPSEDEENEADLYAPIVPHYQPLESEDAPKVSFNSAISLVNIYCAKLPSDTFTRLTPEWSIDQVDGVDNTSMYTCSLRLPINSPVKYVISSYPMPNRAMARRLAALQMCIQLHKENEIDDNLLPIGKENFKARPEDAEVPALPDESRVDDSEARPGTTKRRQYYYKKTAEALTDCRPVVGAPAYLYHINMSLSCPLPEEQNTRGRRIYPPEESAIGFGILTLKKIPKLCPFPIYTRSGEVRVELKLSKNMVVLDAAKIERVATFLNYTFTNVLRLQKYLMLFDPNASENSYIIVPIKSTSDGNNDDINVDWNFLEHIYENRDAIPREVPQEERVNFTFDSSKYHDAVIMPWYRNQDQPQYFYVAEICTNLNPKSSFPGDGYTTFEEYYFRKYNIRIQNAYQPLLDVDHTSARLNFLTPRYVNRKGVALPTSSEETKRAKRENLEQKQILVAELCAIHPFPASLWRQAVCLPCILYRINALLLANQIRCQVARSISLGQENLDNDLEWPPLNFGWSLAEVLRKSKEAEKKAKIEDAARGVELEKKDEKPTSEEEKESGEIKDEGTGWGCDDDDELEIGTWSNDMAGNTMSHGVDITTGSAFPIDSQLNWGDVRYGSPAACDSDVDAYDSDETCSDGMLDYSDESDDESRGLKISYMGENVAEAVEDESQITKRRINKKILDLLETEKNGDVPRWPERGNPDSVNHQDETLAAIHRDLHYQFVKEREIEIVTNGSLITSDRPIKIQRRNNVLRCSDGGANILNDTLEYNDYVTEVADMLKADMSRKFDRSNAPNKLKSPENETDSSLYVADEELFSFDKQPELEGHPGPSPSLILQALTMSNANDGINLERLETIGDSFLKYAITSYLYCTYDIIHEGKLSHLRSKQVSNLNLYRLGRRKMLGESMIATKFEPQDNWLPPCYYVPKELEQALIESGVPSTLWNQADIPSLRALDPTEITQLVKETEHKLGRMRIELDRNETRAINDLDDLQCFIPYNLITQHSIPDKSIADCVEALIGAYLIACGPRGALLFMAWLGINVLPSREIRLYQEAPPTNYVPGSTPFVREVDADTGQISWSQIQYGKLEEPPNPLLRHAPDPENELASMLDGYERLELAIGYHFRDRSYLLQAFTHASYQPNRLTDCYQRLEFLGDAVLDYLITRHLYEDSRQHSPGALTDLRSALVNNTIFASLAVRCGFHKYFRHLSPGLNVVIDRFVRIQEENGHSISEEYYLIGEEDREEAEDVEVPKALGDVFESLAGAIYLDSRMSLDAVWGVYYRIMKSEIELFSTNVPKSPIRELLELEPETAKFGKPEKLADGRRVRVTVDVFGKGSFKGIGRNYRIAKCTAAKCALKKLKRTQTSQRDKL